MKISYIIGCIIFIFFLSNCSINKINTNIPEFTQISVKTWKLYDVSAHASYTIAGELYNINTFNQPGVEQAKNYTYALMGRAGYEESAKTLQEKMSKQ